jgi:hypothetical protein
MAMVFTLVSTLKESAELLMAERANAVQAAKEMEAAKAEEEENRKFQGTAVTPETFLEWREKFRKEMEEKEQREREEKEADEKRHWSKKRSLLASNYGREVWQGKQTMMRMMRMLFRPLLRR